MDIKNTLKLLTIIVLIYSCRGPEGPTGPQGLAGDSGTSDKLIRLSFGGDFGTISTNWYLSPYTTYNLIDFNKRDYVGVDSIVFVCSLVNLDSTNSVYAELYNITDGVSIQNSEVHATYINFEFVPSDNIYLFLPDKVITLGIRVRSAQNGKEVGTGKVSYLFLYRT